MASRKQDNIYQNPLDHLVDFEFDRHVVSVFEDMINRSVPGYATIVHKLSQFAAHFAQNDTNCYDLGCSLGASTLAIRKALDNKTNISIISVDSSKDMLDRAKGYIDADKHQTPVTLMQADIREIDISNASMVVLNFTLQFIPIEERHTLLEKIFNGMTEGACLIVSEKVSFDNTIAQQVLTEMHHQFKREQGYSELEISQKRDAIENIMTLESSQSHLTRLNKIGFTHASQWYQNTAFCSFFAIK